MADKRQLKVYTDGAIHQRGKVGGWAAVIIEDGEVTKAIAGRELDTTSNRMELEAVIQALLFIDLELAVEGGIKEADVQLTSDSQYVVYGASEWLPKWKLNNWRGSSGKISNRDLWENLDGFIQQAEIKFLWVRGHAGNHYNEICDKLAVAQYAEMDTSHE